MHQPHDHGDGTPTAIPDRARFVPLLAALLISLVWVCYGVANLRHHGPTSDSPGLFYAGDRTLFALLNPRVPNALNLAGPEIPEFTSPFKRFPDWADPLHYPVFPSLLAAATSHVFHTNLGWLDLIDGHHLALVLLHGAGLFLFCLYASRLLGPAAGIAGSVALLLYPSAVGHGFNNPKDWPCALFYGISLLAFAAGVVENRGRPLLAAGLLLGVALSCKMNAVFAVATALLWLPFAYLLLYRGRRTPSLGVVGGVLLAPYIAFVTFFVLWPWLYRGSIVAWVAHLSEYLTFTLNYGLSDRRRWTAYPFTAVFFMTQPLTLLAAAVGLATGWRGGRERVAVWLLLLIWLLVPLLRTAAPRANFYDANRHFIEYVPALCAVAGVGAATLGAWLMAALRRWRLRAPDSALLPRWARAGLALPATAAVALLAWPILEYRPFEATYFNSFIGGLGGAQRVGLFYMKPSLDQRSNGTEGDYWWSGLREGVRVARQLNPDAPIALCGPAAETLPDDWEGIPPRFVRPDDPLALVYASPREWFCNWGYLRQMERRRPVLRRVERAGGLIWELLGPEEPGVREPVTPPNFYTGWR